MDFKEYEYYREQKKAYKIFTEDALIDIIIRKNKQIKELLDLVSLQYFNGREWTTVSTWANERMAWDSLGGDDDNYRTISNINSKVLTDKRVIPNQINNIMSGAIWWLYRNDDNRPPWWFWFLAAGIIIGLAIIIYN